MARSLAEDVNPALKRARVEVQPALSFSDETRLEPYNCMMML